MSYARFASDSDIYVFATDHGVECCCCTIHAGENVVFASFADMIDHMWLHRGIGDKVPDRAFADLRRRVELAKTHGTIEAVERAAVAEEMAGREADTPAVVTGG